MKGQQAEQKVLDFAQMTPVSKLSNALEEPLANARAYWSSGRLGEIEAWEAKKGLAEKFGLNWLARGVSSNLPQIGLSMVSGLGMAAKAETAVGWMAKAAPWAERLMFPVAMEAGEATLGMEEKERETGQKIGNLRFGIAGVARDRRWLARNARRARPCSGRSAPSGSP